MTNILVIPEKLEATAAAFDAGRADVETIVETLRGALADLDSEWAGETRNKFGGKCDDVLFPNARRFGDLLDEVARELRCIATTFADLDARVMQGQEVVHGGRGQARME